MNKLSKNQKGFTAVEGLLIILILVVIGGVGYMVYHNNHKTKPVAASTTTANTSISNPYSGWKSFCSTSGKLCLKYPTTWTFKQSLSESVVPEADVFKSPTGQVEVKYFPNSALGPTGDTSTVHVLSVNDTNASGLVIVGLIYNGVDQPNVYYPQLFVTYNPSPAYKAGQTLNNNYIPVVPGFGGDSRTGSGITELDVEQASQTDQGNGFTSQSAAQAWLNSSEVQTGDKILKSVTYDQN
jgi:hypothetical protein